MPPRRKPKVQKQKKNTTNNETGKEHEIRQETSKKEAEHKKKNTKPKPKSKGKRGRRRRRKIKRISIPDPPTDLLKYLLWQYKGIEKLNTMMKPISKLIRSKAINKQKDPIIEDPLASKAESLRILNRLINQLVNNVKEFWRQRHEENEGKIASTITRSVSPEPHCSKEVEPYNGTLVYRDLIKFTGLAVNRKRVSLSQSQQSTSPLSLPGTKTKDAEISKKISEIMQVLWRIIEPRVNMEYHKYKRNL